MKSRFVGELKAGDAVDEVFALSGKTLSQKRDGSPFLNLTLADRTGEIKAVVWDDAERIAAAVNAGEAVRAIGSVSEYRGALQMVVRSLLPLEAAAVDPADFLPTTPQDVDVLFERLTRITDALESRPLRDLLGAFWSDDTFRNQFKKAPAAKRMHHAYIGGLLEHCLSMAVLADKVGRHYTGIDRDLLVAGAILHDIGKVREFEYQLTVDYSDEGRLISHIFIGMEMVQEKIGTLPDFPEETAMLIKHMILSHHGSREFGSPEPPKTIEAVLLHFIDEIDSKVNGIRDFMASEASDAPWTSYHRVLERFFYRGRKPGETG